MKVEIDYTNWRGERRVRVIEPFDLKHTSNKWHAREQWLLFAIDEDGSVKTFAMGNIHSWKELG